MRSEPKDVKAKAAVGSAGDVGTSTTGEKDLNFVLEVWLCSDRCVAIESHPNPPENHYKSEKEKQVDHNMLEVLGQQQRPNVLLPTTSLIKKSKRTQPPKRQHNGTMREQKMFSC